MPKLLKNPHPGDILKEEFLNELGLSQNKLADSIHVPRNRIHAIIKGQRSITADTDIHLCAFFDVSEGYFLRLQNAYDLMETKRHLKKNALAITPYHALEVSSPNA